MKQIKYFSFLLLTVLAVHSSAQEQKKQIPGNSGETKQREQLNFYRKTLQIDSVKAEQVSQVQDNYKQTLKAIIADTSLNEMARRVRIQAAIDGKNLHLKQLLSPAQQDKIIPTTERQPGAIDKKP